MAPFLNQVRTRSEHKTVSKQRAPIMQGLALTAAWLIVINLFALIAFNRLNVSPDTAFEWMSATTVRPVQPSWDVVEIHNRWATSRNQ